MKDYFQPEFYRFNEDSILLTQYVLQEVQTYRHREVLDIGAGCGVIGMELARKLPGIVKLTSIEIQPEFIPYLNENYKTFASHVDFELYQGSFTNFPVLQKYDLVVSNPPYFISGQGRISTNLQRQKCRTFTEGSFNDYLNFLEKLNTPDNFIYFLARKDIVDQFDQVKQLESTSKHVVICTLRI